MLQSLQNKLPTYLALAADVNNTSFSAEDILPFFANHSANLPTWGLFASILAAQQMNSTSAERVFSFLKRAFNETQEAALNDYVQAVVMKRYNLRGLTAFNDFDEF